MSPDGFGKLDRSLRLTLPRPCGCPLTRPVCEGVGMSITLLPAWSLLHQARRRRRDSNVHVLYRAECAEGLAEFRVIANHQHCHAFFVDVLARDAGDVICRYLFHFIAISLQKIERITIELVGHLLAQDFFRRVELEDEQVEDVVFGAL